MVPARELHRDVRLRNPVPGMPGMLGHARQGGPYSRQGILVPAGPIIDLSQEQEQPIAAVAQRVRLCCRCQLDPQRLHGDTIDSRVDFPPHFSQGGRRNGRRVCGSRMPDGPRSKRRCQNLGMKRPGSAHGGILRFTTSPDALALGGSGLSGEPSHGTITA